MLGNNVFSVLALFEQIEPETFLSCDKENLSKRETTLTFT